jgi:hypothetical protein
LLGSGDGSPVTTSPFFLVHRDEHAATLSTPGVLKPQSRACLNFRSAAVPGIGAGTSAAVARHCAPVSYWAQPRPATAETGCSRSLGTPSRASSRLQPDQFLTRHRARRQGGR